MYENLRHTQRETLKRHGLFPQTKPVKNTGSVRCSNYSQSACNTEVLTLEAAFPLGALGRHHQWRTMMMFRG